MAPPRLIPQVGLPRGSHTHACMHQKINKHLQLLGGCPGRGWNKQSQRLSEKRACVATGAMETSRLYQSRGSSRPRCHPVLVCLCLEATRSVSHVLLCHVHITFMSISNTHVFHTQGHPLLGCSQVTPFWFCLELKALGKL